MKLADTIPFSRDLRSPLWSDVQFRPRARPEPGDVVIDGSWRLVRYANEPAVLAAGTLLSQVLRYAYSVPLRRGAQRQIALRVDPDLHDNREAHAVRVNAGGIEVVGASPVGVLHGAFRLVAHMRERGGPYVPQVSELRTPLFAHRIHRSPLSPFYVEELTGYAGPPFETNWREVKCEYPAYAEEDAGPQAFYDDNLLMRLAMHGFNGIWVRGALRKFARCSVFPEFGEQSDEILARLRRLCRRAGQFGLRVFLYLNEPMGLDEDDPFWERYPQVQGPTCSFKPVSYMCTSTPEVKQYLRESAGYVFEHVPELAGVMLITASEYPSHCYSHTPRPADPRKLQELVDEGVLCERCASRTPQEIIGEIITLIRDGITEHKPDAEVIAWNWSWNKYEPDPQRGVLEQLPDDVIVMGDFERGTETSALDFEYTNDEYSIKVVGPSPRFTGVAQFQRERDLPVYAKVQIGTTHENPDVPYLPALHKIARKWHALAESGTTGMMTCWNFGNMPSLATELAGELTWAPQVSVDEALDALATRHFGPEAASHMIAGWDRLCAAQDDFPTSIPVMYYGPVSRGPAFHFVFDQVDRKFPRSWLLDTQLDADRLDWVGPFGAETVLRCYRAVAEQWAEGVALMEPALQCAEGTDRERVEREVGVARMCLAQLTSAANVTEFLLERDAFYAADDPDERRRLLDGMERICRDEVENATAAIPLCDADSRLGWHGEAYGYMMSRELIEEKLAGLRRIIDERIPAERARLEA